MKSKLTMMVAAAMACAAIQLTGMPTEEETRKAEPVVKKMLAQERAALESGKKTRSEVAAAAMKLAGEADTDAAKLLLMKGAFALYVKDGNFAKAVETMRALEVAIADMPPQSVTNMIEAALLGVSKKEDHTRLYKLLDDNKADLSSHVESKLVVSSVEERSSIASILKGMIKVPGRDYWLSMTELTQGQWESVMGYNLSRHKGKNLPVENVSRDDCDVFLEKLNQAKEVKASQFEFRLPELEEWKYAAWAGSAGHGSWIKPGVTGNVLDMAWVGANSSNQTHAVATKAPNAFGFYDMLGNVWEWLSTAGGDAPRGCGSLKGCAFNQVADKCTWNQNWHMPKTHRNCYCGLRLAAHVRPQPALMTSGATRKMEVAAPNNLTGPYGIRMQPDPGCEKGAEYVLKRLVDDYLPVAVRYYGDPFGGKEPSRIYTLYVKRNDGKDRKYTGPSWGGREDWKKQFTIGLAKGSDKWDMDLPLVAKNVLCVCSEDVGFSLYVNDFVRGDAKGIDPVPEIKEKIRKGLAKEGDEKKDVRLRVWREYAPMWAAFEELRARHPKFMLDYCNLKNSRYAESKLPQELSFDQMADLLGEATGENMVELFKKYGVGRRESRKYLLPKISVAQALQGCDFLLNKDFKRNAKFYLCLFSASWCGPCRAEMPRIAKTYVETLKNDPNIELIHFSRDQNDEKALAWAKEHDVKFPVVKPNGGNPLDLRARGIPHLFIVKADGTLIEEGHPKKLFTDEKLRELKLERDVSDMTYTDNSGCTWSYADNNEGSLTITGVSLQTPSSVTIPTSIKGKNVTRIGNDAFRDNAMITGVTIPGCIVGIGDRAFVGCTNLEELTILEGVKAIGGSDAFRRCPKLKSVTIPKSLTFIHQRAFKDVPDESMKVNVDSIEHWLSIGFGTGGSNPLCNGKSYLCIKGAPVVDLKIPDGTKELKFCAFFRYSALKSISIPGSVQRIGTLAFADLKGARIVFASNMGTVEIARDAFHNSSPDCRVEVAPKPGYVFAGWEDEQGKLVDDILNQKQRIVVTPRWAAEKMNDAFSLKAAPGSVTELDLGKVPPLQFVYCPAGKFSMGYKEQPALSKVKDIEISSPFWVSKTPLRVDQLASLGLNSITDTRIGAAGIDDVSIVIQKLPSVLKERFGKMLPPGYVFRLPTEAEFEYLQKAETKDKNAQTNIWGVERLYSGGIIALLDRAPAYGRGVDVVNDVSNGNVWTVLAKVNYENQPDKDPVGWSDDPNWSVFRRRLTRDCKGGKLITNQRTGNLSGFYFVVAPDVDKLNKFYWK